MVPTRESGCLLSYKPRQNRCAHLHPHRHGLGSGIDLRLATTWATSFLHPIHSAKWVMTSSFSLAEPLLSRKAANSSLPGCLGLLRSVCLPATVISISEGRSSELTTG